jgi:Septum formation
VAFRVTAGRTRRTRAATALFVGAAMATLALSGCRSDATPQGSHLDPAQVDATSPPAVGECRMLTPSDLDHPSNASAAVPCDAPHTAETFATGTLPASFTTAEYDDERLAAFAFGTCGQKFMGYLGADESLAMRSVLSWTLFRPSQTAWDAGARWYRCDAVGGGPTSKSLLTLPDRIRGLLRKPADDWLACVKGGSVDTAPRVPCSQRHTFRAVTTIRLGKPEDDYPGDDAVSARTRNFCSDSVAAWLGYPAKYSFAYTWFPQPDWEAGNRRSVCWARTDQ